jgi:heme/copper-type cytochrome/quinol oxidase subunit 2
MKRSEIAILLIIAVCALGLGFGLVRSFVDQQAEIHVKDLTNFAEFDQKLLDFMDKSKRDEDDVKVVVPAGTKHLYMRAEQWQWFPDLEISASSDYILHIASRDVQHSFHLENGATGQMIDILIQPNKEYEVLLKDLKEGVYAIGCTEYCGLEHNKMRGRMIVSK